MNDIGKRKTVRHGGGTGSGRRGKAKWMKTAGAVLLLAVALCMHFWAEAERDRRVREHDMWQAERNRREQGLRDSLEARRQELIRRAGVNMPTPEQRRAFDRLIREEGRGMERADELLDKYNRGVELTPAEKDIVYDAYQQEYYEDPDDEGHYPSEIFDDREDYDEEHVRNNPGVAGED